MAENRTTYKFEGDATGLIKTSKKLEKALSDVKKESKKSDTALKGLEGQAEQTATAEVALAAASGGASLAMGALAVAAGAAAAALAVIATAIASVIVVAATLAAGFVAAAVGIHKLITGAKELHDELEPLYKLGALEPLKEKQLEAIEKYTRNWEALKVVFKELLVVVAGNLAGDLEDLSFEILVIAIYLSDLAKKWLDINSVLKASIVEMLINPIIQIQGALLIAAQSFKPLVKAHEFLGLMAEGTWDKIESGILSVDDKARALANTLVGKGAEYFTEQLSNMTSGMEEARQKAQKLIESLEELGKTETERAEALTFGGSASDIVVEGDGLTDRERNKKGPAGKEKGKGKEDGGPGSEKELNNLEKSNLLLGEMAQKMTDLTDPTGIFRDVLGEVSTALTTLANEDLSNLTKGLEMAGQLAGGLASMFSGLIQKQLKDGEELTEKQKKNLKVLFAAQKAATISQIIMNTASASIKAYEMFGPPPSPVGVASAIVVAGLGAAQAAVVAGQKPKFHTGGIIPSLPSDDGVMINALPGEAVLNREATAGLGAEGVSAINSGTAGGGAIAVSMIYKHRIFDNFVQDNISKGGPLRDAIKGGRRVGHKGS